MPIVALVGRPNVGKSTLFNRLIKKRVAIVHDRPGVTRDRHYGDMQLGERLVTLIDTGGFDPESDDPMKQGIKRHIETAIEEADAIVCVLDAKEPATSADHAELALLRQCEKPVLFVANKADSPSAEHEATDFYRLGIERLIAISALHGRRIDELERALEQALPEAEPEPEPEPEASAPIRVALIGRPNAGKSSLVNRLLGEERLLVDDRPGTTRDPIDSTFERGGQRYVIVDTAGIRRKSKVRKEDDQVEIVSVVTAIRAIERCDVAVLLCDAAEGVAEQDAKIMGLAAERGRAIVVALNKIDLLDRAAQAKAEENARDKLTFAQWAHLVRVSAKKGRGLPKLLQTVNLAAESFRKRVSTGELNRFFENVLLTHPPPTQGGRAPRFYFITQAETRPPLFVVVTSHPDSLHFSYTRFVENQLRKAFSFESVPIRVRYKPRRRRDLKKS